METNEVIALGVVALAALLALRYFLGKKGSGCCGTDCLSKFEKKDGISKPENKK